MNRKPDDNTTMGRERGDGKAEREVKRDVKRDLKREFAAAQWER